MEKRTEPIGVSAARAAALTEAVRILGLLTGADVSPGDVLFFGTQAEVVSPVLKKYGVDKTNCSVYNESKHSDLFGSELFCNAEISGGFIELELSGSGFKTLFELFENELPFCGRPKDVIPLGCCAEYAHAGLIHAAATAKPGYFMPYTPLSRRALWLCMMAASPAQKSIALSAVAAALNEHRIGKTLCARVAEAMAAAVLDRF